MVTYVRDASAVLRLIHNEAGSDRIADILYERRTGNAEAIISSLHWGEIVGILLKRARALGIPLDLNQLESLGLNIIPATRKRAEASAHLRVLLKMPYVDSFGVELAAERLGSVLVTGDFDFKTARAISPLV